MFDPEEKPFKKYPHAFILEPVWQDFDNSTMVGMLVGVTVLTNLFDRLVPEGTSGIIAVLDSPQCGSAMSFELNGRKALFLGYEDVHEAEFDEYRRTEANIEMYTEEKLHGGHLCGHDLHIYPSSKFRVTFDTTNPIMYTSIVAIAFAVTIVLLIVYDFTVTRRQNKTMRAAVSAEGIVTSLFPKAVGKQMVEDAMEKTAPKKIGADDWKHNTELEGQLVDTKSNEQPPAKNNLAQHYESVTIMFGGKIFNGYGTLHIELLTLTHTVFLLVYVKHCFVQILLALQHGATVETPNTFSR